jgi:molybdate transport system substrate-binding protein
MKRFAAPTIFLIGALLVACGPAGRPFPPAAPQPRTLTVFAASSLAGAFPEMGRNFEAVHPGVTVTFNFAGSGSLRTQLEQGAVADVFAPANQAEMDTLIRDNLVAANSSKIFLTNSLLIIMPADNPAKVQTLHDLARPGLKLILGDTTVPAGKYARQILANLARDPAYGTNFSTQVLANVASNETDVKQVLAKVQLGEADAGIVYVSDAVAAPQLKTIQFPAADNVIAKYPIAALNKAPQPDLAASFIAYVLSQEGQAVLKKWGFTPLAP